MGVAATDGKAVLRGDVEGLGGHTSTLLLCSGRRCEGHHRGPPGLTEMASGWEWLVLGEGRLGNAEDSEIPLRIGKDGQAR
ncbi:hypothetical protein GCM10009811_16560 [Nostocoides veronense]|uniref:Uncharacterized protein n=1 Tax=Nostocoides veronense TaxID=330836 RepID=A0ABP4XTE3_9MICO